MKQNNYLMSTESIGLAMPMTAELVNTIADKVAQSVPAKVAAGAAGVPGTVFDTWMATSPPFAERMERAENTAMADVLERMHVRVGNGDRHAAQFLLANRYKLGDVDTLRSEIISKILSTCESEMTETEYVKVLKVMRTVKF